VQGAGGRTPGSGRGAALLGGRDPRLTCWQALQRWASERDRRRAGRHLSLLLLPAEGVARSARQPDVGLGPPPGTQVGRAFSARLRAQLLGLPRWRSGF